MNSGPLLVWGHPQGARVRTSSRTERAGDVEVQRGRLRQTLLWQSPAFTEIGYSGPDDIRVEAKPEWLFGEVLLFLDHAETREHFTNEERGLIEK